VKLRAFLNRYAEGLDSLKAFSLLWNGAIASDGSEQGDWHRLWSQLQADMPIIFRNSVEWQKKMIANGDFASNLLMFAAALRSAAEENKV
jgi:hypothetical protein